MLRGKYRKRYIFLASIKNDKGKTYRTKFIDNFRFIST